MSKPMTIFNKQGGGPNASYKAFIPKRTSIPSTVSLYPDCTYSLVNVSSGQFGV